MKRRGVLLAILGAFLCFSSSYANITSVDYASDGDGAFVCDPWSWSGNASEVPVGIYGDLFSAPGHLLLNVTTDSVEDPTLKISNSIENDSTFAWTKFTVNLTMAVSFTLTNVTVTTPGTWSVVSFDQTAVNTGSNYLATVVYNTGPAIPNDAVSTIDFGYDVKFIGSPSYTITQEMIPVPEPSTLGLTVLGGLLFARTLRRGRRQG